MAQFHWESLLKELSLKLIEYDLKTSGKLRRDGTTIQAKLTLEIRKAGWLGYPGATAEQIINAENR